MDCHRHARSFGRLRHRNLFAPTATGARVRTRRRRTMTGPGIRLGRTRRRTGDGGRDFPECGATSARRRGIGRVPRARIVKRTAREATAGTVGVATITRTSWRRRAGGRASGARIDRRRGACLPGGGAAVIPVKTRFRRGGGKNGVVAHRGRNQPATYNRPVGARATVTRRSTSRSVGFGRNFGRRLSRRKDGITVGGAVTPVSTRRRRSRRGAATRTASVGTSRRGWNFPVGVTAAVRTRRRGRGRVPRARVIDQTARDATAGTVGIATGTRRSRLRTGGRTSPLALGQRRKKRWPTGTTVIPVKTRLRRRGGKNGRVRMAGRNQPAT